MTETVESKIAQAIDGASIGFAFMVLFTLKVQGIITASWWIITAILWGPLALGVIAILVRIVSNYFLVKKTSNVINEVNEMLKKK